jgi:hypothetical protein
MSVILYNMYVVVRILLWASQPGLNKLTNLPICGKLKHDSDEQKVTEFVC